MRRILAPSHMFARRIAARHLMELLQYSTISTGFVWQALTRSALQRGEGLHDWETCAALHVTKSCCGGFVRQELVGSNSSTSHLNTYTYIHDASFQALVRALVRARDFANLHRSSFDRQSRGEGSRCHEFPLASNKTTSSSCQPCRIHKKPHFSIILPALRICMTKSRELSEPSGRR